MRKSAYVGKESIEGDGIAICDVINSDIATGDSIVFNRETGSLETLRFSEKRTLTKNVRKLAEEIGGMCMGDEKRFQEECKKIEQFCEEHGLSTHGFIYNMMVKEARKFYVDGGDRNRKKKKA